MQVLREWLRLRGGASSTDVRSAAFRVVAVLAYSLALHWSYASVVSPHYAFTGLTYREPHMATYVCVLLAVLVCAVILPARIRRVSDFALWVIFLVTAAPSALLAQYTQTLPPGRSTALGLMVLATLVLIAFGLRWAPRSVVPTFSVPPKLFYGALVLFACGMYATMLAVGVVNFTVLKFTEVHQVRVDYKEAFLTLPLMGYLGPALQAAVNPFFIAVGLHHRRWLLLTFGAMGQVFIYLASGQKVVLLFIGAALAVALLFRRGRPSASPVSLTWAFVAVTAISTAVDLAAKRVLLTPVFMYRMIMLPAALTAAYAWVFDDLFEKLHFSTVLPFLPTEYDEAVTPPVLVGQVFNNAENTNANVNFFGDGYMHLGYAGMLIEGAMMLLLLWLADEATRRLPLRVACILFLMPVIAVTNGSAFTAVLTLGFGAALVLAFTAPATDEQGLREGSVTAVQFR